MSPLGSVYFNLSTSVYFFSIKIDLSYNLFSDFIENKKQQYQIHSKHFGLDSPEACLCPHQQTPAGPTSPWSRSRASPPHSCEPPPWRPSALIGLECGRVEGGQGWGETLPPCQTPTSPSGVQLHQLFDLVLCFRQIFSKNGSLFLSLYQIVSHVLQGDLYPVLVISRLAQLLPQGVEPVRQLLHLLLRLLQLPLNRLPILNLIPQLIEVGVEACLQIRLLALISLLHRSS